MPVGQRGGLAALARLDVRAAQCGAHLVVSTSVAALDDVFACLDQSHPQILVDPSRADRVIALGRVLAAIPNLRVRELAEEDRLLLLRLTEQVGRIAERLDSFGSAPDDGGASAPAASGILWSAQARESHESAFRFEAPRPGFNVAPDASGDRLVRPAKPSLPDPRMIRRMLRHRQLRARFFDGDLFGDPAWDMLLDLAAARAEKVRVSVTSLCIASGVPPTTALRWIGQMTEAGLFQRIEDETDRRRAFIALTDKAADAMAAYFAEIGTGTMRVL